MSVLTTILARWPAAILWCQGSFPWAHGGESESESEVAQSWQTLCDPMDCTLQDSSVHGIFQAGVLEWVAISFSRDLPNPGIEPRSPAFQVDALPSESESVMISLKIYITL